MAWASGSRTGSASGPSPTAIVTVPPVERGVLGSGDWPITRPTLRGSGALGRLDLVAGVLERLRRLLDGRVAVVTSGHVRARLGHGDLARVPPGARRRALRRVLREHRAGRVRSPPARSPSTCRPASSSTCVAFSTVLPTTPGTKTPSWPLETVRVIVRPLVACLPASGETEITSPSGTESENAVLDRGLEAERLAAPARRSPASRPPRRVRAPSPCRRRSSRSPWRPRAPPHPPPGPARSPRRAGPCRPRR